MIIIIIMITIIMITIIRDLDRDKALVAMLAEAGSLENCESVIVYCTRREECERLATLIRFVESC